MTVEVAREFIAAGFFMLLVLLRLDADQFGTAEYDRPFAKPTAVVCWLAWFAIGAAFLAAIYAVFPRPQDGLYLLIGRWTDVLVFGLPLAALGAAQAAAYARYRYGYLRLPAISDYPRAAINSIGTAALDEASFRGVLLGALVWIGVQSSYAIAISTVSYLLVTRLAAPGRRHYMLLPAAAYGLLGGWATLATGGIGAAIVFHSVSSFALFVCTGHSGQPAAIGREPEEVAASRLEPEGWQVARRGTAWGPGAEPRGLDGWAVAEPLRGEAKVVADSPRRRSFGDRVAVAWGRARDGIGRTMHRPGHA